MFSKEDLIDVDKSIRAKEKKMYSVILALVLVLFVSIVVILILSSNKTYRISLPPNLEFGATVNTGEIDHFEIYSFAGAITQQLNLWKDGKVDFRKNMGLTYINTNIL